jgi:hypothetical protein
MFEFDYLTDRNGRPKAVVIPIEIWNKLLPKEDRSFDELSEVLEDYYLDKAMDEGKKTPLLNRNDALKFSEGTRLDFLP